MAFREELQKKFGQSFGDNIIGFKVTVMEGVGGIVEGYKGVSYVTAEEIRFRAGKTFITLFGKNLEMADIASGEAYVLGTVTGMKIGKGDE